MHEERKDTKEQQRPLKLSFCTKGRRRVMMLAHDTLDAVFDHEDMKVDEKAKALVCEF